VPTKNRKVSRATGHAYTVIEICCAALSLLCGSRISAQTPASTLALQQQEPWSFSASLYSYFPHDSQNYVQPTLSADRDWLHLEMRYNYEALYTTSAWVGYNFGGGKEVAWTFSPLLGGVFGKISGIAPGYNGSLSWRGLELYSEGEFVFDTSDSSASYFYNWSELSLALREHWRLGLVAQHTRVYQTDREIQRGLLVGMSYKRADLTAYVLNPDTSTPILVVALRVSW
jgi:hypothetical protein